MKYRRIEVNAYRRRVTIVSGEWPRDNFDAQPESTNGVSLNDTDCCEPVSADSPDGQLILVAAVRCLERRLSPEARATIRDCNVAPAPPTAQRNRFYLRLQSLYRDICPTALRFIRKEK